MHQEHPGTARCIAFNTQNNNAAKNNDMILMPPKIQWVRRETARWQRFVLVAACAVNEFVRLLAALHPVSSLSVVVSCVERNVIVVRTVDIICWDSQRSSVSLFRSRKCRLSLREGARMMTTPKFGLLQQRAIPTGQPLKKISLEPLKKISMKSLTRNTKEGEEIVFQYWASSAV